jgi:diguanylate cyclase (GGDEF)-like protein
MPRINRQWCEIASSIIIEAQERLNAELTNPIYGVLPGVSLQDVAEIFFRRMEELMAFANEMSMFLKTRSTEGPELNPALVPLFKALFLQARLTKARFLDQQRARTTNPMIITALDDQLKVYDGLIREDWFQAAAPDHPPSLRDILTLEQVEKMDSQAPLAERQYDEKFHLLQAPGLFLSDLNFFRSKCGVRGLPLAVAFLDIDKFKDFNTTFGHTNVNRNVLPVFMAAVEAQIYGHGYAYRMSGDEYALLMPNADSELALAFLKSLRRRVAALKYLGVEKTITLSVGLCIADRDCFLTDEELLQRGEKAMAFAKEKGRNRIAGYNGKLFDDRELDVLVEEMPEVDALGTGA